jgi:O-acetylserine/cysteine efflux transporter
MTPRQIALALVPPICFGTGFTVAKPAMAHFPPLFTMALTYGGIALALAAIRREPLRTPWWQRHVIAAFAVTIQGAFLFWGLAGMTATAANLVLQVQVPFAIFWGWLLAGERLSPRKLLGTAIAIGGVAGVIGLPREPPPLIPVLMVITSALAWSLGQVLAQKLGRDDGVGQLQANAAAGLPQLIIATVLIEHGQLAAIETATPLQWAMLAFVALVGFGLAYASWYSVLRVAPIDEVAPFVLLMPVVGIATAFFALGEPASLIQLAGGVVILMGLAVVVGVGMPKNSASTA